MGLECEEEVQVVTLTFRLFVFASRFRGVTSEHRGFCGWPLGNRAKNSSQCPSEITVISESCFVALRVIAFKYSIAIRHTEAQIEVIQSIRQSINKPISPSFSISLEQTYSLAISVTASV